MAPKKGGKKGNQAKKVTTKFVVDCGVPVGDSIIDMSNFEKFMQDRIKVEGKVGVLQGKVEVSSKDNKLTVAATIPFSKRYLKYLSKKYLKKNNIRDLLRLIATDKNTYKMVYLMNVGEGEE